MPTLSILVDRQIPQIEEFAQLTHAMFNGETCLTSISKEIGLLFTKYLISRDRLAIYSMSQVISIIYLK